MGMAAAASAHPFFLLSRLRRPLPWGSPAPPRRLSSALRCSPPTASASSYNGWADLAAAPDLPIFPLPIQSPTHGHGLLILVPAAAAAALALALVLSLSRLPPLPLLAAAFTAGFAARHLSDSAQPRSPGRLAAALADLDAQARALRDQLLLSGAADSEPALLLVQAVDRLRDAVADHTASDADVPPTPPVLGTLGELAHCFRAWARHAVRDLSLTTPRKKQPHKPDTAATAPQQQQQQQQGIAEDIDRLERLVSFNHRHVQQNHQFPSSIATGSMESRTLEIRDRSYRLNIQRQASDERERFLGKAASSLDPIPVYDDATARASDAQELEFTRNVEEAADILNRARECMLATADQEAADALLYQAARLLSTAVALRPTSLIAVGQLGNTYLLHGELKLKVSRELRQLLANSSTFLNGTRDRPRKLDTRILSRDSISSALVAVCEECESLLVEAGRSYKTALSIDSGDVKALYNWGLALIFRAQLLADIGPEAAVDADRVYLAAIDKFDAMLSKSNTYAPEALYRWGIALQQRSHLRPRNNRDKIRLLEQAKSLFEDVLYVEADNKMVREALSSCVAELNYHGRWL